LSKKPTAPAVNVKRAAIAFCTHNRNTGTQNGDSGLQNRDTGTEIVFSPRRTTKFFSADESDAIDDS
jgi:hypothetical protein